MTVTTAEFAERLRALTPEQFNRLLDVTHPQPYHEPRGFVAEPVTDEMWALAFVARTRKESSRWMAKARVAR